MSKAVYHSGCCYTQLPLVGFDSGISHHSQIYHWTTATRNGFIFYRILPEARRHLFIIFLRQCNFSGDIK